MAAFNTCRINPALICVCVATLAVIFLPSTQAAGPSKEYCRDLSNTLCDKCRKLFTKNGRLGKCNSKLLCKVKFQKCKRQKSKQYRADCRRYKDLWRKLRCRPPSGPIRAPLLPPADPLAINRNHRHFADDLTGALYETMPDDSNHCSSSWGVSMAFGLVYPGADETNRDQMRSVLRYPSSLTHLSLVWKETADRLDAANDGHCQSGYENSDSSCDDEIPLLEIANSIWLDDGSTLVPAYHEIVGDFAKQIDFQGQGAGGEVNAWVANNTNDLIDSIVEDGPFDPNIIMIAINSIYLKASWEKPFPEHKTNEDTFYSSTGEAAARFMHTLGSFKYSHDALPDFQILQLPFNGNSLSMIVVLPMATNTEQAKSSDVLSALSDLQTTSVAIALPKFKFESEYAGDLMSSLMSLGLTAPFVGGLCDLIVGFCGFVSAIIQKTVIDVHEKGVEAAAVTMIVIGKTAVKEPEDTMLFLANEPFQFFIYDNNEELVLFEGLVRDPGIPSDAPSAQLDYAHSDLNFWEDNFGVTPVAV